MPLDLTKAGLITIGEPATAEVSMKLPEEAAMQLVRSHLCAWCVVFVIAIAIHPTTVSAQALVIEGGTLIDGNGGPPIADAVVVIEGNRITRVGEIGQGRYPRGADVIDAR